MALTILIFGFQLYPLAMKFIALDFDGTPKTDLIFLSIKQILLIFGLATSIVFYIRWMNKWFEEHSQAEFQLQQFQLDIERASWLVEMSLEWKEERQTQIPDKLIESISRNLFDSKKGKSKNLEHPADQLASALLGTASKIQLKAGDSSIEIDPKKLLKISQEEKGDTKSK